MSEGSWILQHQTSEIVQDNSFSTYAKAPEKVTSPPQWHPQTPAPTKGEEILAPGEEIPTPRKMLHTHQIDNPPMNPRPGRPAPPGKELPGEEMLDPGKLYARNKWMIPPRRPPPPSLPNRTRQSNSPTEQWGAKMTTHSPLDND